MLSSKNYLIVKACAGLGNRLVTIFGAIDYSKKNNRKLVIDWTDGQFDKNGVNAFNKCFELIGVDIANSEDISNWQQLTHSSNLFKENKKNGVYDLYIDKSSSFWLKFPAKLFVFNWQKKIRRRWQPLINGNFLNSINYGSDLSNYLSDDVLYYVDFLPQINYSEMPNFIKLKPNLVENINHFVFKYNLGNAVGVHIRFTDKKPTDDIQKLITYLKKKYSNSSIYLATDSTAIEKIFEKEFQSLILFPKNKPQLNGEGLHQWALYHKEEELKYVMYEESVMEMFLLSKCNYLYYQGNSTFSTISKTYHINKSNCYDWLKL